MTIDSVPVDAELARALLAEYVTDRRASFPGVQGYRAAVPDPAQFTPPAGVFLVASQGDEVLGCGGVRRIDDPALGAVADETRFEIKHLFVRPPARGTGTGKALLHALERHAAALGATQLVLDTNRALVPANRLYESNGYAHIAPYNDNPNATEWFLKRVT